MRDGLERGLTWILALLLVASAVTLVAVALNPPETTDPYTEFYVLGPDGEARDYPTNLTVGETGRVIVGISNHEHREVTYTLIATLGNRTVERRSVTVGDDRTVEEELTVTPESPGRTRYRLLLYRGEVSNPDAEPYKHLRLWIDVREASA